MTRERRSDSAVKAALAEALKPLAAGKSIKLVRDEIETDPVVWVRRAKPKIEDKEHGLVPFTPWPHQQEIMRAFCNGRSGIVDKGRQTGVSTCIMVASAHQLLYGVPLHQHIIANKEDVAVKSLLKAARRALDTAILPDSQRKCLRLGGENTGHITYSTSKVDNYIMAHAASEDAARSFSGNCIVIEEAAFIDGIHEIWASMGAMIDDGRGVAWIVSTYNGDGDWFCDFVDNAADRGFLHYSVDWWDRPGRDEEWKKRSLARMQGDLDKWEQEHERKRLRSGEQAFDCDAIRRFARNVEWIGGNPIVGHRYSGGIDQASSGDCSTVAYVIDTSVRPAQFVACRVFKFVRGLCGDDGAQLTETQQKIMWMQRLAHEYPGSWHIDATQDPSIPPQVATGARGIVSVKFTATTTAEDRRWDPHERVYRRNIGREYMLSHANANFGTGKVVLHQEQFGDLMLAIATARKNVSKRTGKNVDHLDAAILANLGLTRGSVGADNESKAMGLESSKRLGMIRTRH